MVIRKTFRDFGVSVYNKFYEKGMTKSKFYEECKQLVKEVDLYLKNKKNKK